MRTEYRVTNYSPEHLPAMVQLLGQLLRRSAQTRRRYFIWKYLENPYVASPLFALVFAGQDLVAMRGLMGAQLAHSDGPLTVGLAEDLVIDAGHRNRGLFLLLDRELQRVASGSELSLVISLSAQSEDTQALQRLTGWRDVDALRLTSRPKQTSAAGRMRTRLGTRLTPHGIDAWNRRAVARIGMDTGTELSLSGPDPQTMAELASRHHVSPFVRTAEFYDWRLRNPDRRYAYATVHHGELLAFAVLGLRRWGGKEVDIVEVVGPRDVTAHLVQVVTRSLEVQTLDRWAEASEETHQLAPVSVRTVGSDTRLLLDGPVTLLDSQLR